MPSKIYHVKLTNQEREELTSLVSKGRSAARKQNHARILLLSDENCSEGSKKDKEIIAALGVSQRSVERVRQRFVEEGLENALLTLNPKPGIELKNWMGPLKPFWSLLPAHRRPKVAQNGRYNYWQISWLNVKLQIPLVAKLFERL